MHDFSGKENRQSRACDGGWPGARPGDFRRQRPVHYVMRTAADHTCIPADCRAFALNTFMAILPKRPSPNYGPRLDTPNLENDRLADFIVAQNLFSLSLPAKGR